MTIASSTSGGLTSEERRALLKRLVAPHPPQDAVSTIVPDSERRYEPFPLTEIQQAYWLGRDPAFPLGGVGIHGYLELDCRDLDVARLEKAWNETICRHDMMRVIVLVDGTAKIIENVAPYRIAVEDLTAAGPQAQRSRIDALRARMSHQVFDVSHWPLFEIRAVRFDARTTRLFFSEDAIHMDLASSELVVADWLRLYRGEILSPPSVLSFRDYALALDRRRHSHAHAKALEDLRARLADLPDPPDLPRIVQDDGLAMTFHRRKMTLPADAWASLKRAAADRGLTPSDILLTAYADVLGCWSSTRRFLVNVTLQRRLPLHPDIGCIAGDFTSFTLLDVDLNGDRSFVERAFSHRDRLWRDLENVEVSGIEQLRELALARGQHGNLVVPYVYTSALGTAGYRRIDELGEIVHEVTQTPQVLIDQQVLEVDGTLVLSWDSVDGAFPPVLIDTMFATLESVVRELAGSATAWQRQGGLSIPREQRAVRDRMNATGGAFPHIRLDELFCRRSREQPDAVAVIDGEGTITYRELDTRSSRLADALVAEGALRPGEPVALALRKGRAQIIAIFAALKAGAAYLPLDLSSPPARIARVFDIAACRHVIVDPDHSFSNLPADVRQIAVSAVGGMPGAAHVGAPRSPRDTAYVLFTSGSTGDPKGVPISHTSVVNRMHDVVARFSLGSRDRGLALTKLHHDLSVFDVFGLLAVAGGSLVMTADSPIGPGNPRDWVDLIGRYGVTIWNSVPASMEMLLASGADRVSHLLATMRLAMLSGDWIPPAMPAAIKKIAPQVQVVSLGGPTETTVWDICHPIEGTREDWPSVPYGRPMRNARYNVLRDDLSECPDWVAGELYLSGVGLTAGYLNPAPDEASRFLIHPQSGRRLFRSGDLGRIRPGGVIEFLGRKDRQIKIGGHRIELGEVEAALRCHPSVGRAVAFTVITPSKQLVLAAAYTAAPAAGRAEVTELAIPLPLAADHCGERHSALAFPRRAIDSEELARLLAYFRPATNEEGETRRRHPSAGRRYAVSIFVQVRAKRVVGLCEGLYRFDAVTGRLTFCGASKLDVAAHAPRNMSLAADAALTLLLVAAPALIEPEYGDGWRDLCLLEAGYMGQLAMDAAASSGLGICPIGGLDVGALPLPLDVVLLHALLVGGLPGVGSKSLPSRTDITDLKAHLATRLPPNMIPAVLMRLDAIPATGVGKPDVAALRRLALAADRSDAVAGIARTTQLYGGNVLNELREAVTDVLGRTDLPVDCPLQEAGATSIDIVRIHARLTDAGHKLTVTDMFRFPTIATLAEFLSDATGADAATDQSHVRAAGRRAAFARLRGRNDV
jgi:epothilone synthetase B